MTYDATLSHPDDLAEATTNTDSPPNRPDIKDPSHTVTKECLPAEPEKPPYLRGVAVPTKKFPATECFSTVVKPCVPEGNCKYRLQGICR